MENLEEEIVENCENLLTHQALLKSQRDAKTLSQLKKLKSMPNMTKINQQVVFNINNVNIENKIKQTDSKKLSDKKNLKKKLTRKMSLAIKRQKTRNLSELLDKKKNCKKCWKETSRISVSIIKSIYWSIFSSIIAFLLLILQDLTFLTMAKEYDFIIESIFLFGFCFLSVEIFLTFIFVEPYRFSFFFYIDCFAVFCLFPSIGYFNEPIFNRDKLDHVTYQVQDA